MAFSATGAPRFGFERIAPYPTPRLIAYLNRVFERRPELDRTIDLVLLTHAHVDHTLGVSGILDPANNFRILDVVTNAQPNGSGIRGQRALLEHATNNGIPSVRVAVADITRGSLPTRRAPP